MLQYYTRLKLSLYPAPSLEWEAYYTELSEK